MGSGNAGYTTTHALLLVALAIPGHLYELMPIAVLIGAIFVMASLRKALSSPSCAPSGMGPLAGSAHAIGAGMELTVLTVAVGDYIAPECCGQH